jgi:hypothetical protein
MAETYKSTSPIHEMRCFPSLIKKKVLAMSHFDWPITQKKMKLWRLPKIEVSILKYRVPPLWPTYIGERRTTFAKAFGIKARCYWELFEELGNSLL